MLRPRSNYYERSRAPCSGPGRVIVAWTCAGSTRSWHRLTSVTCYHDSGVRWHMSVETVIAIITAVQYLENNPGLNDCENKSKLCTSGAALMIINKHFKRAALTMSGQLLAGYYWAVNGQHNEYTNPFKPSDLEFLVHLCSRSSPIAFNLFPKLLQMFRGQHYSAQGNFALCRYSDPQHTQNNMWSK